MKKLIISVGLIVTSLNAFPQVGGLGGSSTIYPSATNNASPSSSYGGALSGAPSNTPNYTPGTSNTPSTSSGTGILEQQRMEEPSLNGSSLGGSSSIAPSSTNQMGIGTGPGLGTGTGTGVGTGSGTTTPTPASKVPYGSGIGPSEI